jgi:hypothetical protein
MPELKGCVNHEGTSRLSRSQHRHKPLAFLLYSLPI